MILSIVLLLLVNGESWQYVSCFGIKGNFNNTNNPFYRGDENSILDVVHGMRYLNLRSRRDSSMSLSSTETSIRMAYETAMNQTITDYYAQRKAVMERYYARQREIVDKFRGKTTQSPIIITPIDTAIHRMIFPDNHTTSDTIIENTTEISRTTNDKKSGNNVPKSITQDNAETNQRENNNNSSVSWIYRMDNWNSSDIENGTDVDFQSESSDTVMNRAYNRNIRGYYKLGDFKGSDDEKIVYQHNLGIGLKGSSQLEATFEAVLEGAFAITAIEAFPFANTRANISWIAGGPGTNSVKLRLKGYENEGFSYTVKVWGVPI